MGADASAAKQHRAATDVPHPRPEPVQSTQCDRNQFSFACMLAQTMEPLYEKKAGAGKVEHLGVMAGIQAMASKLMGWDALAAPADGC